MMTIETVVVDASLAVDALAGEPSRQAVAARFLADCDARGVRFLVPPAFPAEADTALRQSVLRGLIAPADLAPAYALLDGRAFAVERDEKTLGAMRRRARIIAAMLDQPSVYDATYAALAELHGGEFWTADKRFFNAANQRRRAADGTTAPGFPFVRFIGTYGAATT